MILISSPSNPWFLPSPSFSPLPDTHDVPPHSFAVLPNCAALMDAQLLNNFQGRGLIPILSFPPLFPLPGQSTSSSQSVSTSSSASSSAPSSASASASTTSSSSTISTSATTSSQTPVATPSATPPASTPATSADPSRTTTVFQTVSPTSSASPSATSAVPATQNTGFLQNKALSGAVFGVVGLIVLVLIVFLGTCLLRRSRNKRLVNEAISFDPVNFGKDYPDMIETGRGAPSSDVRSTSSMGSHAHGPLVAHSAPFADYAPPAMYMNSAPPSPRVQKQPGEMPPAGPYSQNYQNGAQAAYARNPTYAGGATQSVYRNGSLQPAAASDVDIDRSSKGSRSSSTELKFAATTPAPLVNMPRLSR